VAASIAPQPLKVARHFARHSGIACNLERDVCFEVVVIDAYDQQGPLLNAIITVNEQALAQADALDAKLKATGKLSGPLHGIPFVVKDNIDTGDLPTSGGSASLADFQPERDGTTVERIRKAGGILLAKASLAEFANGGFDSINSRSPGYVRNPYNTAYASGGSSGGTGVAMAANFAVVGLGTDAGISVRAPASINSVVGLRVSHGLVSLDGVMPLNVLWDTVGPMARTVHDTAILLEAIAGPGCAQPDQSEEPRAHCQELYVGSETGITEGQAPRRVAADRRRKQCRSARRRTDG
jgi:amidase